MHPCDRSLIETIVVRGTLRQFKLRSRRTDPHHQTDLVCQQVLLVVLRNCTWRTDSLPLVFLGPSLCGRTLRQKMPLALAPAPAFRPATRYD